jgi:hypothetical protein
MSSRGQVYRFAVGESAEMHATVWRLWNPAGTSDLYLGSRYHAGMFKLSIHENGERHARRTPGPNEPTPPNADRWFGPPRDRPGLEFAWGIITPFGALRAARLPSRFTDSVTWIPQAPRPYMTAEFLFVLSFGLVFRNGEWPEASSPGMQDCLLRWRLPNGETLFLLRRVLPMTQEQITSWGRALIGTHLPQAWELGRRKHDHRAHLFLDTTTGYHGLVDLAYDV